MTAKTKQFSRAGSLPVTNRRGRRRRERVPEDPLLQILRAGTPSPPAFLEPMKCKLVSALPVHGDWLYELKFDGFRAIAIKDHAEARLISRNQTELSGRFPEVVQSIRRLKFKRGVLDGEIVVLDESGRPSFPALQNLGEDRSRVFYFIFDVLNYDGTDLTQVPFDDRRYVLQSLMKGAIPRLRIVRAQKGRPEDVLARVRQEGLEGVIAKKRLSRYEPGQRSGAWVKCKNLLSHEFVIGGYTSPEGTRAHFGSLVVGYYARGKLLYASKVGTGFTSEQLELLHCKLQPLVQIECPFANLPEDQPGRWGQGLTATEMKRCTWVRPALVCEVAFTEWTDDDRLRHPSFKGLREDRSAQEVKRERPT